MGGVKEEAKEGEEGGRNRKEKGGEEEVGDKMQEHKCNSHKTKSQTEKKQCYHANNMQPVRDRQQDRDTDWEPVSRQTGHSLVMLTANS